LLLQGQEVRCLFSWLFFQLTISLINFQNILYPSKKTFAIRDVKWEVFIEVSYILFGYNVQCIAMIIILSRVLTWWDESKYSTHNHSNIHTYNSYFENTNTIHRHRVSHDSMHVSHLLSWNKLEIVSVRLWMNWT